MFTTAAEIARAHGLDPKRYRQTLRDAQLTWYVPGAPWTVSVGSPQHEDMLRVLRGVIEGRDNRIRIAAPRRAVANSRDASDEAYVIDLCDEVLGHEAIRQHGFDFLRGDPGKNGHQRTLPVDAWYPNLSLVIEYRERQHSETVGFFDRRQTVSGVGRGEQRKVYDQRRRDVLPVHGVELVEFDYHQFSCSGSRRLIRCDADKSVVARGLRRFIS